jgi:hypothetical protein
MTNTPAREGLPELPEPIFTTVANNPLYTAAQMLAFREEGIAAYIASQPTQGGEVSQELRDAWDARLYNVPAAQALAPLLAPGYRLIYRDAFRWKDANGSVLSNHYEWFNAAGLAADFGYAIAADLGFAAVIRDAALPHPQPARGEAVACETCGGRGEVGGWSPGDGYDAELCPDCTTPSPPSDAAQGVQAVRVDEAESVAVVERSLFAWFIAKLVLEMNDGLPRGQSQRPQVGDWAVEVTTMIEARRDGMHWNTAIGEVIAADHEKSEYVLLLADGTTQRWENAGMRVLPKPHHAKPAAHKGEGNG